MAKAQRDWWAAKGYMGIGLGAGIALGAGYMDMVRTHEMARMNDPVTVANTMFIMVEKKPIPNIPARDLSHSHCDKASALHPYLGKAQILESDIDTCIEDLNSKGVFRPKAVMVPRFRVKADNLQPI